MEGDHAGAERAARDRLSEAEAGSGPASLETARALDLVVEVLVWLGSVADPHVLTFAARAVEIKTQILGPAHQELARSLNNQANLLWSKGRVTEARPLQERALAIVEAAFGPDHLIVSSYLNDLANLLCDMGEFEGARQSYERAIAIRERSLGPDHFEVARLLVNLGNLYRETGRFEEARAICERTLIIVEKELGPQHQSVADQLDSLAIVLRELGNFSSARAHYERAMHIREEALGAESPAFAMSLHNLGDLLQTVGDTEEARGMYERALALREKTLGPEHPHLASTLTNLGTLLSEAGGFETAKKLHERALAIWEKALGPEHPNVGAALSNLAEVEAGLGSRTTARSLFRRSVETFEKAVGPGHPAIAEVLTHLADLLVSDGESGAARPLCERALRIRENTLGADHPALARTLLTLARIDWAEGRTEETIQGAMRAEQIARRHFQSTAGGLSEREVLAYERIRASGLDLALTTLSRGEKAPAAETVRRVWDEIVRSRALVLDEMVQRQHFATAVKGPEVKELGRKLNEARARLGRLAVIGEQMVGAEWYRGRFLAALRDKERAERALARRSAQFRSARDAGAIGFNEVERALPGDAALIAYTQYEAQGRAATGSASVASGPSYMALVFPPGREEAKAIPLGPADRIDALIGVWLQEVSAPPNPLGVGSGTAEMRARRSGADLWRAIGEPLAGAIAGARQLFVVPDGMLHRVNLAALPEGEKTYRVETGPRIHYLSAERDLARERRRQREGGGLLVLGGPDFDAQAPVSAAPIENALKFTPLPASKGEANEIEALWLRARERGAISGPVLKLEGEQATEEALKRHAAGRQVVHLATHGFFTARPLLSGLALAGANRRGARPEASEDGILTSEEVGALDLSGVDWVVLSACETGAGEVQAGEGVLGLRRAFEVAGARTLILSLWPVDDVATRQWMRKLYEGRLAGLPTSEAVRLAAQGVLEERRRAGRSAHPFFWAGFVATGDWR